VTRCEKVVVEVRDDSVRAALLSVLEKGMQRFDV
jgi:hypothetical protein